ncbi:MAG: hypothetical protein REH83_00840 [Rickettsiella sp.]|nr:hypothetical protein [Rickettsiella sp.]
MKCFYCGHFKTVVLDSRGKENFSKVMRRRCCPKCKKRTTTFERTEEHYGSYENIKKDYSNKLSYIVCYKSILKQLKLLQEAIHLIHPDNHIDSDINVK